ncbi:hypothetical protein [Endozoicomonas sp.]|uniref:hypothetical protein n=1 Tax=Endozoicomonas sp. TaxID=1892382 RepID=UPI003AF54CBB
MLPYPGKAARSNEAAGKSKGGLTTKIHASTDALENTFPFIITACQVSEYVQANATINGLSSDFILAGKGYDSNEFIKSIEISGAQSVTQHKSNRLN